MAGMTAPNGQIEQQKRRLTVPPWVLDIAARLNALSTGDYVIVLSKGRKQATWRLGPLGEIEQHE